MQVKIQNINKRYFFFLGKSRSSWREHFSKKFNFQTQYYFCLNYLTIILPKKTLKLEEKKWNPEFAYFSNWLGKKTV